MVKSLQTRDVHVALARRHAALAEFQQVIAKAQAGTGAPPLVQAAMEWRFHLENMDRAALAHPHGGTDTDALGGITERDVSLWVLDEETDRIAAEQGSAAADSFVAIARGKATPLLHYVDAWLAEGGNRGPVSARTQRQYRSDLATLEIWARPAGVPPIIEAFTKAVAGRYVTEGLLRKGEDRKTANRKISAASAYWRWLVKRTSITDNPWAGQSLPKAAHGQMGTKAKRAFTTEEVISLLNGGADPELADAMRVAALSGMRIEEIYRLTVADCANGWFVIRRSKTHAGVRQVPIHSALNEIITRRCAGKGPSAFLFPEAGPVREGRERSMAVSKRFGHYRVSVGP